MNVVKKGDEIRTKCQRTVKIITSSFKLMIFNKKKRFKPKYFQKLLQADNSGVIRHQHRLAVVSREVVIWACLHAIAR